MSGFSSDLTAILLAGGNSTRFGERDKLLARLGDRPLVQRVVDALGRVSTNRPIIAVRRQDQRERICSTLSDPTSVRFASDDATFSGPVAGVYGTLPEIETAWVFVCAGDMPLVSSGAIEWLGERAGPGCNGIVPVNREGWLEPLHAMYRREALESVRESIDATASVRSVLRTLDRVDTVPVTESTVDLESSCTNVNTRERLAMLRNENGAVRLAGKPNG